MMREPCPWRAAVARAARGAVTAAALGAMISGCSGVTEVSTLELEGVVARDGVPFAGQAIPTEFLDRLSPYRVVVVGETHLLVEHRELMAALRLHPGNREARRMLLGLQLELPLPAEV